jgi:hypothetical protein
MAVGQYVISCESVAHLAEVCVTLVKEGICFEADTRLLRIICTGGF